MEGLINHIVIIGRQGCGKTTLAEALADVGFTRTILTTTRPPRDGEENGVDYWFVDDKEFDMLQYELVGVQEYNTVHGLWRYGVDIREINADNDTVTVLDPRTFLDIRDDIHDRFAIYMNVPKDVRMMRCLYRAGYDPDEVQRREEADEEQFAWMDQHYQDFCDLAIRQVVSPEEDVQRILRYLRAFNADAIDYDGAIDEGDISTEEE